jgi:hypothetical protein
MFHPIQQFQNFWNGHGISELDYPKKMSPEFLKRTRISVCFKKYKKWLQSTMLTFYPYKRTESLIELEKHN